jgi:hypothetical protein
MGYLNKATITVDAILTNRGRELLAQSGRGALTITKFSIADDEIDYGLYNVAHPEGSEYYGSIIENMPVLEATPDEQQIMRYKLVTLDSADFSNTFVQANGTILIPSITGFENKTLNSAPGTPQATFNIATNPTFAENYTLIVANANLFNIYGGVYNAQTNSTPLNTSSTINANGSITLKFTGGTGGAITTLFTIAKIEGKTGSTTATLFGDRTGATASITITVN